MKIKRRIPMPFFLEGNSVGLLLIHGFTGSTAEFGPMSRFFHEKGFTVHAPLLAGHGTAPEEMAKTGWSDWWKSAVAGYENLQAYGCKRIYVAGLSMGGVLALRIGREYPVQGVISMCAPMFFKDRRANYAHILQRFKPYIERGGKKPPHIEENIIPYDRTPVKCVASLKELLIDVRTALNKIEVPALVIQGAEDETINPEDANYIIENLGSGDKQLKWYSRSSHIIVLDHEREQMFQDIFAFIQRVEGKLISNLI